MMPPASNSSVLAVFTRTLGRMWWRHALNLISALLMLLCLVMALAAIFQANMARLKAMQEYPPLEVWRMSYLHEVRDARVYLMQLPMGERSDFDVARISNPLRFMSHGYDQEEDEVELWSGRDRISQLLGNAGEKWRANGTSPEVLSAVDEAERLINAEQKLVPLIQPAADVTRYVPFSVLAICVMSLSFLLMVLAIRISPPYEEHQLSQLTVKVAVAQMVLTVCCLANISLGLYVEEYCDLAPFMKWHDTFYPVQIALQEERAGWQELQRLRAAQTLADRASATAQYQEKRAAFLALLANTSVLLNKMATLSPDAVPFSTLCSFTQSARLISDDHAELRQLYEKALVQDLPATQAQGKLVQQVQDRSAALAARMQSLRDKVFDYRIELSQRDVILRLLPISLILIPLPLMYCYSLVVRVREDHRPAIAASPVAAGGATP